MCISAMELRPESDLVSFVSAADVIQKKEENKNQIK